MGHSGTRVLPEGASTGTEAGPRRPRGLPGPRRRRSYPLALHGVSQRRAAGVRSSVGLSLHGAGRAGEAPPQQSVNLLPSRRTASVVTEPDPAQSSPILSSIGGYRIERVLGGGSISTVFLAINRDLPQGAALKVLPVELARNPAIRARFLQAIPPPG